jgi:hypothetical protein
MVIPQEWAEWKQHRVTEEWFKFLDNLREELKEDWANSSFVGEVDTETLQRNSYHLGQAALLKRLKEATVVEMEELSYETSHQ